MRLIINEIKYFLRELSNEKKETLSFERFFYEQGTTIRGGGI